MLLLDECYSFRCFMQLTLIDEGPWGNSTEIPLTEYVKCHSKTQKAVVF